MRIYTPWNSFDVWLHHSIYIYIEREREREREVTRQKPYHAMQYVDLMVFLFQVSPPGANQPNSIKAQVQRKTIEPY